VPYVQSGVSHMYYLSLGASESWGVTSFRAKAMRFESLWFRSIERSDLMSCLSSSSFIVQRRLCYRGAKSVRIERKDSRPRRSGSSALSGGSSHPVSRSLPVSTFQVLRRGASVLSCTCTSCSVGQRSWGVDRYGRTITSHPLHHARPLRHDPGEGGFCRCFTAKPTEGYPRGGEL
jgi:hypothetical protein